MRFKAVSLFFVLFLTSHGILADEGDIFQSGYAARFNGLYSDYAADEDGDGSYDYMTIAAGVNIKVAGIYAAKGLLYDINSGNKIPVEGATHLNIGSQEIKLNLYEIRSPGPYQLKELSLYDVRGNEIDDVKINYTTKAYQTENVWQQSAKISDEYRDYGTDINGDGWFDYLTIDVGIEVYEPGNYSLMGNLYDSNGQRVVWSLGSGKFEKGANFVHMDFDGKTIWGHKFNGTYHLRELRLLKGDSERENLSLEDIKADAFVTQPYNYLQFVDPAWPQKILSGSGEGELLLTILVKSLIPVFQKRYSLDIVGIDMPPISSNWTATGSEFGYSYDLPGIHMPAKPNDFSVLARGVKNLNIGVKKDPVASGINKTRAWISARAEASEEGIAAIKNDMISPGSYQFKIFGEAVDNSTQVALEMKLVKKLQVNGRFWLDLNTSGFPSSDYSFSAKALNGSFCFDEINLESP